MEAYERLETEWANWSGAQNVVACASGTAALHLALEALRLPPGSEVLCPTFTMIACPRAITLAGMVPVFVDCGEDLNLDPALVEEAIGDDTLAILAVHLYGRRADMEAVNELADKYSLHTVEDLAEAHDVTPHQRTDAACWSHYKNKAVGGEEGGTVAFRDPALAKRARQLRCLGFTPEHDFTHLPRGHNYRMSNAHASLILDSLHNADANLQARRRVERWYDAACPPEWRMPPREAVWVYDLRIRGMARERQTAAVRTLNVAGIAARHSFWPCHLQEEYRHSKVIGGAVAERMANEVLYLPVHPTMVEDDCQRAINLLLTVLS